MGAPYRTIVEEPEYSQAISQIERDFPRVRDVEAGLFWSLCRNAEQHYQVPGTKYYIVQTPDWDVLGVPVLRVLYWFDDNHVYVVAARSVEIRRERL